MATRPEVKLRQSQFKSDLFQQRLAQWNRARLAPGFPEVNWRDQLEMDQTMLRLEGAFLEELRAEVGQDAESVPTDHDDFVAWFEELRDT